MCLTPAAGNWRILSSPNKGPKVNRCTVIIFNSECPILYSAWVNKVPRTRSQRIQRIRVLCCGWARGKGRRTRATIYVCISCSLPFFSTCVFTFTRRRSLFYGLAIALGSLHSCRWTPTWSCEWCFTSKMPPSKKSRFITTHHKRICK